jgi:hypothetical protein
LLSRKGDKHPALADVTATQNTLARKPICHDNSWASPGRFLFRPGCSSTRWSTLMDDDLDTTILRLADTRAGRHQQMRIAEALDRDRGFWHTVLNQFRRDRLGAPH